MWAFCILTLFLEFFCKVKFININFLRADVFRCLNLVSKRKQVATKCFYTKEFCRGTFFARLNFSNFGICRLMSGKRFFKIKISTIRNQFKYGCRLGLLL